MNRRRFAFHENHGDRWMWHHKGVLKIEGAQQEIDEIWERVP